MLLKIKNKTLLAMDKLLKDADDRKAVTDYFVFEPKEAADFIREIRIDRTTFKKHVEIKQNDETDNVDIRFILKQMLTAESMHLIVNKWFKQEITIYYHGVEIQVIKKKVLEVTKPEPVQSSKGWDTPDVPTPQGPLGEDHVLQPIEKEIPILPPPPPTPPPSRLIYGNLAGRCESCGSSVHYKWGFFGEDGCIQPKCEKYYKK